MMSFDRAKMAVVPNSLAVRLVAAMIQALALLMLTEAATKPLAWPATQPAIFIPLLLMAVYAPLVTVLGCSALKPHLLAIWTAAAAAIVAALGLHEATRGQVLHGLIPPYWEDPDRPRFALWLVLSAAMFIAHVLIVDSATEHRFMPDYRRHFDTAWKFGLQAVLATVFIGVFWGILELGASLFSIVELKGFSRLLRHDWFYFPATTMALAVSIHATDVQPALIRGARTILLALFSWLLPLLAAIIGAFLACLPLISLKPLWSTHFATSLLLIAAAALIFLINGCYQDGDAAQAGQIKRVAARIGAVELVPILGLAVWALSLRVGEHGWTVDRIYAAAISFALISHALGYAAAALWPGPWLRRIEITNFVSAYVMLALVLVLFSPVADPARLMVADQLARLKSGAVQVQDFDYADIRSNGAKWGQAALKTLASETDAASALPGSVTQRARETLVDPSLGSIVHGVPPPHQETFDPAKIDASVVMFPTGRTLPPNLYQTTKDDLIKLALRECASQLCVGHYISLHGGKPESLVLIFKFNNGAVLDQGNDGTWHYSATVVRKDICHVLRTNDLKSGAFALQPNPTPDIVVGEVTFGINPQMGPCPETVISGHPPPGWHPRSTVGGTP